jgi:MFS transporter, FHS family, L-fucose permease
MAGKSEVADVNDQQLPSSAEATAKGHNQNVTNTGLTGASALTVRQSIYPITLVTTLFFLWGFAVSSHRSIPIPTYLALWR